MTIPVYQSTANLKSIYERAAQETVDIRAGALQAVKKMGTKPMENSIGALNYICAIQTNLGASAGFPTDSTGLTTQLGNNLINTPQFAITPSFPISRARVPMQIAEQWKASGDKGLFVNQTAKKVQAATDVLMFLKDAQFSLVGEGNCATVTAAGSSWASDPNHTSAVQTATINYPQYLIEDGVYQVYRSGVVIANVVINLTNKSNGVGTADDSEITVQGYNDGTDAWVPTVGDVLAIINSETGPQCNISGIQEGIGTGAYPRSGANNVPLTDVKFESVDYTMNAPTTASSQIVHSLIRLVEAQNQGMDFNAPFTYNQGKSLEPNQYVIWCTPFHIDAIRNNLNPSIRWTNEKVVPSQLWGDITEIDNIPFLASWMASMTALYLIHGPSWAVKDDGPVIRSGQLDPWQAMTGTIFNECVMVNGLVTACVNRKTQGVIRDVLGVSSSTFNMSPTA